MPKEGNAKWPAERKALEEKYIQQIESMDQELIRTRKTLVRVLNILSGRDSGEVRNLYEEIQETISICMEALGSTQHVIGRIEKD